MRPHDLDADAVTRLERLAARHEGREQDVAERAVLEQERPQLLTLDCDVAHPLGHDRRQEHGLPREQIGLAEKARGPVPDDLGARGVEDGGLAFDDRDQRIPDVTNPEEHVADLRVSLLAVLGEQGKLRLGENRRRGCHTRTLSSALRPAG